MFPIAMADPVPFSQFAQTIISRAFLEVLIVPQTLAIEAH
jgi:hypothetical protein